jgi:nucleoside-diphosphate-sugar epimerase
VVGLDNFNDYYDPQIKRDRVAALCPALDLRALDLTDREGLAALFDEVQPTAVIHLAAQAGVRYSLENPHAYVDSNLVGFVNMLELCRHAACSTWCMPPAARSTAIRPRRRSPRTSAWTSRARCTRRPRRPS